MFKGKRIVLVISVLLLIALFVLAACQSEPTEVEVTRVVEVEVPGETSRLKSQGKPSRSRSKSRVWLRSRQRLKWP